MVRDILIKNGLTEKEAKIYLEILRMGELPFSAIAKNTGIKRSTVYAVSEEMEKKGYITTIKKKGRTFCSAINPQILISQFKQSAELAESILPQLLETAFESPLTPRIQYFEGLEGLKTILDEVSYSKGETIGFTDYGKMPKALFEHIRKSVVPLRKEHQNFARLICPKTAFNAKIQKDDPGIYTEHRLVQYPNTKDLWIELLLFGDSKVSVSSFKKQEMFGFILDSQAAHDILKNIFEVMWKIGIADK